MIKLQIETINHNLQRYPTVGDWFEDKNGVRYIKISDMNNEDYEFLISIHEQIEQHLCKKRSITEESVTAFDEQYERVRLPDDISEPGDDTRAPYYKEHQYATVIEKLLAYELGVDWTRYDETVSSL